MDSKIARCAALFAVFATFMLLPFAVRAAKSAPDDCRVGSYLLGDGSVVDVGNSTPPALRWRRPDGTSGALTGEAGSMTSTRGWTGRPDGHRVTFDCAHGRISFDEVPGKRIQFDTHETRFDVAGVSLAGRLIMPPGKQRVPVVVLVHGSEDSSALDFYSLQRLFPVAGIGAFTYDKRGTGASTGTFTHDYHQLAADAAAALREARRLAGRRATRVGFQGSSQGGWVAPLAAELTPVDFVIVAYGLAVSPMQEDDEAIALDMTRHGFGAAETEKALEIARAAQQIVEANFQSGYEELIAVRAKYAAEPWARFVRGNVTQVLLSQPPEVLRKSGPTMFAGILPHYDPMPVLGRLTVPQLWILAADDIDAPVAETLRRLKSLQGEGKPLTIVVYPRAEHGMYEYEVDATGERLSTGQPATYLPLMRDFVAGKLRANYGDSDLYR
jgi:pimeloyl-ACP methyl ester carboxylesterase